MSTLCQVSWVMQGQDGRMLSFAATGNQGNLLSFRSHLPPDKAPLASAIGSAVIRITIRHMAPPRSSQASPALHSVIPFMAHRFQIADIVRITIGVNTFVYQKCIEYYLKIQDKTDSTVLFDQVQVGVCIDNM